MRAVIQRVKNASVTIDGEIKSSIDNGLLVLLGICEEDNKEDVLWLVRKIAALRIFDDNNNVMNKSVIDVNGEVMIVSQFTLMASYKKGNRPSWIHAASHETAIPLYEMFINEMSKATEKETKSGIFGADMKVSLINDGPVTICMDTKNKE